MSYERATVAVPVPGGFVDGLVVKAEAGCNHIQLVFDDGKLYVSTYDSGLPLEEEQSASLRSDIQDFVDALPGAVDPAVFHHREGHPRVVDFAPAPRRGRTPARGESGKAEAKARAQAHDGRVAGRERARVLALVRAENPAVADAVEAALS